MRALFVQNFYFYALLQIFLLHFHLTHGRNTVRFLGLKCVVRQRDFGEFQICNIKAIKREVVEINVFVKVFQKPIKNLTVVVKSHRRGYEHLKPSLDFKIDLCTFYRNKRRNPLAEVLTKLLGLQAYTNLNHSCPYDHDIVVDKYHLNEEYLRYLPFGAGTFRISTFWWTMSALVGNVYIDVEIKES